ncbi:MAG: polyprenyl synthetase family protein [Desulfovibrio sp.]|jgi:octaprenyl-diphosphate synthase|nr:polyprenyl synthetase family protein [Desulfovibrio sp.]
MQELKRILSAEQPNINRALGCLTAELPQAARPVAEHLFAAGGKRLRPLLTLLTGRAFGCRDKGLYTMGAAIEMLHAATLLHDDILDDAATRRGQPTAHTLYGTAKVILAGDALLAKALLTVSAFGDTRLTASVSEAVMRTAVGEIAEFDILRDTGVSHQNYLEVVTGKTAWMLRASCELGALLAGVDEPLARAAADFGLELGVAFQMVDDALDFAPAETTGKPRGGDLREGKMTPPLLSYLASLSDDEARAFRAAFAEGAFSDEAVEAVSAAVVAGGHARRARDIAEEHLDRAAAALALFPESDERVVLRQLLGYIQHREH